MAKTWPATRFELFASATRKAGVLNGTQFEVLSSGMGPDEILDGCLPKSFPIVARILVRAAANLAFKRRAAVQLEIQEHMFTGRDLQISGRSFC